MDNEDLIVIADIMPKAPVHFLVIPKKHIESINHLQENQELLVGKMLYAAKEMAEKLNIADSGYKAVFNVGRDGGQVVKHLHLHVLGGKKLEE